MNGPKQPATGHVVRYFTFVAVSLGLAFALVNDPEAPGVLAGFLHFVQWQAQTIIPIVLLMAVQQGVSHIPFRMGGGTWVSVGLTGLIGAFLFAPLALALDTLFLDHPFTLIELIDEFAGMAPTVVVCWLAMNAPLVMGFKLVRRAVESVPAQLDSDDGLEVAYELSPESEQLPAFYQLIPQAERGQLIYLKAELHYLSVVTDRGRSLILYALRDAIAELPSTSGIQVHRGYWVAIDHVKGLHKLGRQGEIEMSNGERVPVSRKRLSEVQETMFLFGVVSQ